MRLSRKIQLPQTGGIVHKIWRAHNKDFLLSDPSVKKLYLNNLFYATNHSSVKNEVAIHAFCIMSNHVHESVSYKTTSDSLSMHMRIAHGRFGQEFNRRYARQGPVAYDRPKTPVLQGNIWNQIRVHFYIEANPLRAKMVRNLKLYPFSSFRFYAWGIEDEYSVRLVIPQWYLNLGNSPKRRQSVYRALFEEYLKEFSIRNPEFTHSRFIGDPLWIQSQDQVLRSHRKRITAPP